MAIHGPSYLLRTSTGYIFRYKLPADIVPILGRRELRYSVRTGVLSLAKSRTRYLSGVVQQIIRNIRQGCVIDQPRDLIRNHIKDFLDNDSVQVIARPTFANPEMLPKDTPPSPVLSDVLKEYKAQGFRSKRWTIKTFESIENTIQLFIRVSGDKPINKVTITDTTQFFKILQRFPVNVTKQPKYTNKSMDDILKIALRDGDVLLAINTINDHMSRLSGLFGYAKVHGLYTGDNPAKDLRMTRNKRDDEARCVFDTWDLRKIFQSEEYTTDTFDRSFKYWVPILGLFTGARINEICQLYLDDIKLSEGVWYLDINTRGDKELKNLTSRRVIPLHPFITQDLNFIRHVNTLKAKGDQRLFPDLKRKRDGYAATVSRWFSRYKESCGIVSPDRMKTFHSFRHTFDTTLKYNKVPDIMCKELMGHAVEGMGATYQKRYPVSMLLKDGIMKLDYLNRLNLEHLKSSRYTR